LKKSGTGAGGGRKNGPFSTYTLVGVGLTAALALPLHFALAWPALVAYLSGLNLVTLGFYGWDKAMARRDRRRVPELTLHLLAVAGGSPGAYVAQRVFRHKTRKTSFRVVFWLLVLLQAAALGWAFWKWQA
jgi:uncharacterized membrane protein YsdA (DUF1294 family)